MSRRQGSRPGPGSRPAYRLRPAGERAVYIDPLDAGGRPLPPAPETADRLAAWAETLHPLPEGIEAVLRGYATLYVEFDPERWAEPGLVRWLDEVLAAAGPAGGTTTGGPPARVVELPVLYGGDAGPDLEEVARAKRLAPEEVIRLHSSRPYRALALGFSPGFAYLGELPAELEVDRLAVPRRRVPAGSVAIAGRQTAVYPSATPGGWRLIGRCPLPLLLPGQDPPVLIRLGDEVRFRPVDEAEFRRLEAEAGASSARAGSGGAWAEAGEGAVAGEAVMEVVRPGFLTTVQDLGRQAWRGYGFVQAGALDRTALMVANALVGNPPGAAALEVTVAGPVLRFLRPVRVALAGADLDARLDGRPVRPGERVEAEAGQILRFGARRRGARAYLAVAGGLDLPVLGGSRSTDLVAGLGGLQGRPLRAGDRLGAGKRAEEPPPGERLLPLLPPLPEPGAALEVRVTLGPDDDLFEEEALARLFRQGWRVARESNRTGMRLEGEPLAFRAEARSGRAGRAFSEPVALGAVQVPPSGEPILLLADRPTIGGYARVATVVDADVDRLAQLVPGDLVHLVPVSREAAREADRRRQAELRRRLALPPA
ncbi:MAG: 5-oxoprolinase subunit PxpB [Bacillota bacterium]|nr:5-oxoprolinase subunit PxpB [Bacillota bacterium]